MFTLSDIFLEDGENLFRNFGVRLVFIFIFLPSGIIKKTNRLRTVPERDTARGQSLNSATPSRPSPSAPPRSARAVIRRRRRRIPPPEVRRASFSVPKKEKKFGVRRFSFSWIKSVIFLIAIPDLIFVLV